MGSLPRFAAVLLGALALSGSAPAAERVLHLCDFETAGDVKAWDFVAGTPRLVDEGAAHGRKALEIKFDPKGRYSPAYISWRRPRRDWSGFDAVVLDVLNPGAEPIAGYVLIADQAWADKGRTYWNRHNSRATFAPGRTRWVIPVGGLFRGEAGSRNNDIQRDIDPDSIVRVDFGFGNKGSAGRVVIDDLRLVKADRPAGVWAFDFGPRSQSVMLGWTGVSHQSAYTKARGFGWGPGGGTPWDGAARDTTFGTALLRDFCEAGGYRFHVDAPAGRYRVTLFYENSGYWGGEQAMHARRRVLADGREVWSETRPDGAAHALYRFEDVEPIGVDVWETYMKAELARPVVFEARAGEQGLTLGFDADRPWGSKLAGLAIHRSDDAKAGKWLADQLEALAAEFRGKAVCLDAPALAFRPPPAWKALGLVAWPVHIEADVTPNTVPPAGAAGPRRLTLSRLAARGEMETVCVAVRPLQSCGRCRARFQWTLAPSKLPTEVCVVRYNTSRGFGNIAYRISPHTLRRAETVDLPKDVTRELVVRIRVPADAQPGAYRGQLVLTDPKGTELFRARVHLDVADVTLDRQTDFRMGFYGLMPPGLIPQQRRWEVLDETLTMLREYGMNMVAGGPSWRLTGWKDGRPLIDFGEMDRFFALLRKHGFTGPINGYGGVRFAGLHDRYQKGRSGQKVERDSGLEYGEALLRAWQAVHEHARANDWPTIWYAMCDETRVRDVAERELAFMEMMASVTARFPRTVRTVGDYSVDFATRPKDPAEMLYWHQRFFEALDVSCLNRHDPTVLAEARRLGKEVQIYNQGRSRYSFGLYQWSEHRKGVTARTQWHLNILHGYQFFDLDGREPDTAMICYGRRGLYPTIHFERCREGAEDFYLYNTLWRRIAEARRRGGSSASLDAGEALLEKAVAGVALNQRRPPATFDADEFKVQVISAIQALGRGE